MWTYPYSGPPCLLSVLLLILKCAPPNSYFLCHSSIIKGKPAPVPSFWSPHLFPLLSVPPSVTKCSPVPCLFTSPCVWGGIPYLLFCIELGYSPLCYWSRAKMEVRVNAPTQLPCVLQFTVAPHLLFMPSMNCNKDYSSPLVCLSPRSPSVYKLIGMSGEESSIQGAILKKFFFCNSKVFK